MFKIEKEFEDTMTKAAGYFVQDVIDTGKEILSVEIDRECNDFTCHIGNAGGLCLPLAEDEDQTASLIASEFALLLIAQSNEKGANLNFQLTTNTDDLAEITVTRISKESMN